MRVTVRPATLDDLDVLAALRPFVHDRHVAARPEYFKPITPEAARQEAASCLAREDGHLLLAELDGVVAGYVFAYVATRPEHGAVHARRVLYLDQIAVDASRQHRGCGTALIDATRALARRLGIAVVELEVWDFNDDARRFFAGRGFAPMRQRLSLTLVDPPDPVG
jgi:diamine N-acetyltransferase